MAYNKGFTYAYGWNIYYQKILGVCAVEGESLVARQRAWIWIFLLGIAIWIPQTFSIPLLWGELNQIINCLSTNLSCFMAMLKIMALQCQRRVIGSILITIAEDWMKVGTKEELDVMMHNARFSNLSSKTSFSLTNIAIFALISSQMWLALFCERDPNLDPRLAYGFIFEAYFPFDTTSVIVFVPIWLSQAFASYLSAVAYAGPDCFVAMAVLHLCGQLRIIRNSLKTLVNEATLHDPKKYWQRLGAIVTRHEQINKRASILNETFSSLLLAQMLLYSVTFCFQGYLMFMNFMDENGTFLLPILLFNAVYAIYTIIHLYVYCYVGDKLFTESTNISDDFYETAWYDLRPKEAMSFIHVCHRAAIPLELRAGKFCTFNMRLFNAIMKNSMGYLSMLMAVKDRL